MKKTGYYIITPWRKKYIGELPGVVRRKGKKLPFGVYLHKCSVFMTDPTISTHPFLGDNPSALNRAINCYVRGAGQIAYHQRKIREQEI